MSGGISDVGANLHFIPTAGRKKVQVEDEGEEEDYGETTGCSMLLLRVASHARVI